MSGNSSMHWSQCASRRKADGGAGHDVPPGWRHSSAPGGALAAIPCIDYAQP